MCAAMKARLNRNKLLAPLEFMFMPRVSCFQATMPGGSIMCSSKPGLGSRSGVQLALGHTVRRTPQDAKVCTSCIAGTESRLLGYKVPTLPSRRFHDCMMSLGGLLCGSSSETLGKVILWRRPEKGQSLSVSLSTRFPGSRTRSRLRRRTWRCKLTPERCVRTTGKWERITISKSIGAHGFSTRFHSRFRHEISPASKVWQRKSACEVRSSNF